MMIHHISISMTLVFICVHLYGCQSLNGLISFDCNQTIGICPGEPYELFCSIPSDYLFKLLSIESDNCTKKEGLEVDFFGKEKYDEDHDEKCGKVNGTIRNEDTSWSTIQFWFTASKYLHNGVAKCFAQDDVEPIIKKLCPISIAVLPDPPMNLSITSCLPAIVTWTEPNVLRGKADHNLRYNISVTSSAGVTNTYKIKETFMQLHESVTNEMVTYNVCISTVNCVGMSKQVCVEKTIAPTVMHLKGPMLNSTILNSSSIELTWNITEKHDLNGICFDIEINSVIVYHCIKETSIVIRIRTTVKVHMLRVRAQLAGMPGEWSKPECAIFAVPFPVKLKDYSVTTEPDFKTTTVNLSLELQDKSNFIGGCKVSKVTEIHVSSKVASCTHTVEEEAMEHNISLIFNKTGMPQSREKLKISVKAMSNVGSGPEQLHYVLLKGSSAVNLPSLILITIVFIIHWAIR